MNKIKELVVVSGKGGTGKTSLTVSLACLATDKVLADGDVDAADLHLILEPTVISEGDFVGGYKAVIVEERCRLCQKCLELCRFGAIIRDKKGSDDKKGSVRVDPMACEGCAVCARFCPHGAIELLHNVSGRWFISRTRHGPMVHARLGVAEENSGKLVALIRQKARQVAEEAGHDLIIIDGPPGIGCPVIASVTGSSFVLMVTEPTLSAFHDLRRAVALTSHFGIPTAICINKKDINPLITLDIRKWAEVKGIKVLGQISYDNVFTQAQLAGKSIVEYGPSEVSTEINRLWEALEVEMGREEARSRG